MVGGEVCMMGWKGSERWRWGCDCRYLLWSFGPGSRLENM